MYDSDGVILFPDLMLGARWFNLRGGKMWNDVNNFYSTISVQNMLFETYIFVCGVCVWKNPPNEHLELLLNS